MKKLLILLLLLIVASSIWAEYGKFGVGAIVEIDNIKLVDPMGVVTKDNYFRVQPVFSMMLSESFELMPYAFYDSYTEKTDGTVTERDSGIGGGVGLYWHFIRTQHFRVMTGATIELAYDFLSEHASMVKDNSFIISAYLPVIVDMVLNDMITFRASLNIFTLSAEFRTWDLGLGENSDTNFYFDTIEDISTLSFGFIYRFG